MDQLLGTNDVLEEVDQRNLWSFVNDCQSKLVKLSLPLWKQEKRSLRLRSQRESRSYTHRGLPRELLQKVSYFGVGLGIDAMYHLFSAPHSLDLCGFMGEYLVVGGQAEKRQYYGLERR